MEKSEMTSVEQRAQLIRFRGLRPTPLYTPDPAVPEDVYETILPPIYLLMGPSSLAGAARGNTAIVMEKNFVIGIIECAPAKKVPLHVHLATTEIFFCLKGRFRVRTRDTQGLSEVEIEPMDMILVPAGVYRDFENVTGEPALMMAMSLGEGDTDEDDLMVDREESEAFARRLGSEVLEKVSASTGYRFPLGTSAP